MSDAAVSDGIACPECGARNQSGVTRCWLCGAAWSLADAESDVVTAQVVPQPAPDRHLSFTLATIFVVITLVAVACGVARIAPGLAVLIGLVGAPAVIITGVRSQRQRAAGHPMSRGEKFASFLLSAAIVAGVLYLLFIASGVAFFLWCLAGYGSFPIH